MELSVHGDRTGHDGQDVPEPSGDAEGLCILKSPRHQRASGAHAQNQPGWSKSTATKLAAPRRLIMSSPSPKYESFGIVRLPNLHFRGQSEELQVFQNLQPSRSQTWAPWHTRAVKFKYPTLKTNNKNTAKIPQI